MDGEVSVKGKGKDNDGRESGEHPVLVVLVGAPGSGKSTFCESVMRAAVNRPWVRICQVPSMRQLHLHVISQDFDSPHLKNKKHWNSFNTCFFRDSADVIEEIDSCGMADISNENLLQMELRCHRCRSAHPNIPKLKSHVSRCNVSLPPNLLRNGRLVITSPIGPDKQIC